MAVTFDPRTIQREVLEEFSDTSAFGLSGEDIEQMTLILREEAIRTSARERMRENRKKAPRGMRACRGCGVVLPVREGPGKPQEWCSDACRMRHKRTCSGIRSHY